jgi:hypothetical protein
MILYNKMYSKYHLINIIIIYSNFVYKDHNNEIKKHGLFYKKFISKVKIYYSIFIFKHFFIFNNII